MTVLCINILNQYIFTKLCTYGIGEHILVVLGVSTFVDVLGFLFLICEYIAIAMCQLHHVNQTVMQDDHFYC